MSLFRRSLCCNALLVATLFITTLFIITPSLAQSPQNQPTQAQSAPNQEITQSIALNYIKEFKISLKKTLVEAMKNGPEAAIQACQLKAPELTRAHSDQLMAVGRSSHKLRNPANAPPIWVKPLMDQYRAGLTRDPQMVEIPGDKIGLVEPIYLQPICTTCHGQDISAPLQEMLAKLYPADQATGFNVGDFRGIFWVTIEQKGLKEKNPH